MSENTNPTPRVSDTTATLPCAWCGTERLPSDLVQHHAGGCAWFCADTDCKQQCLWALE